MTAVTKSKATIFLSYAKEDLQGVQDLYQALREAGLCPVMDEPPDEYYMDGIPPGCDWKNWIRLQLESAKFVLAFLSSVSVAKEGYVQREFLMALEYQTHRPRESRYLIPVMLESCSPPGHEVLGISMSSLQWYKLYRDGVHKLIEYLKLGREIRRAPRSHEREEKTLAEAYGVNVYNMRSGRGLIDAPR